LAAGGALPGALPRLDKAAPLALLKACRRRRPWGGYRCGWLLDYSLKFPGGKPQKKLDSPTSTWQL